MFKKNMNLLLACKYLPSWMHKFIPWDTEYYANPQSKKAQSLPICHHCGLCMTGNHPCPAMKKSSNV